MKKKIIGILLDSSILSLSYLLAYLIRFEGIIPIHILDHAFYSFAIIFITTIAFLLYFKVYQSFAKYVSLEELYAIIKATTFSCIAAYIVIKIFTSLMVPRSVLIIYWLLVQILLSSIRIAHRFFRQVMVKNSYQKMKKVLIIGAGDAGEMIIRRMIHDKNLAYNPVGLIDDDPNKQGMEIHNVPVLGSTEKLAEYSKVLKVDEILIAIPSAGKEQLVEIIKKCVACDIPFKSLPGLKEIMQGKAKESHIRNVKIEDLLDRTPIETDISAIKSFICGKIILVTGAAGSVGSELCKQIIRLNPSKLVLYDKSENEMFKLENELKKILTGCKCYPLVANILDTSKLEWVMRQFKPDIIFHAAAHKHVSLMEQNPEEAIKNNTIGTIKVALSAISARVDKFIFISTDKAVSPTSIMGASKRLAELFLQNQFFYNNQHKSKTKFIIVRFGNVLRSNGSVIPIFQQQIEAGGPVKVTEPRMTRFFMTITEAVHLILQAAMLGEGGEIFILDMGKPLKILDIAKFLISSYGYKPGRDIKIEFIGRRPGEKLHEELWYDNENPQYILDKKLLVCRPMISNQKGLYESINVLKNYAVETDRIHLIEKIATIIKEYKPSPKLKENEYRPANYNALTQHI